MTDLIETHCHLDLIIKADPTQPINSAIHNAVNQIMRQAAENSVTTIITIGTNIQDSSFGATLAATTTGLYATVGIHPTEHTEHWKQDIALLAQLLQTELRHKIVAIGECGIDTYRSSIPISAQKDLFRTQIDIALEHNLALVVHSRNSADETLSCLDEYAQEPLRAVIHCFSYDGSYADEFSTRGITLGIGGTITYPKNETLRDTVRRLPLDAFVLETDAPFLAPQSIRGENNHPKEIRTIADFIAQIRTTDIAAIAAATSTTAQKLFGIAA
jgi:TatD DNase family protein